MPAPTLDELHPGMRVTTADGSFWLVDLRVTTTARNITPGVVLVGRGGRQATRSLTVDQLADIVDWDGA